LLKRAIVPLHTKQIFFSFEIDTSSSVTFSGLVKIPLTPMPPSTPRISSRFMNLIKITHSMVRKMASQVFLHRTFTLI